MNWSRWLKSAQSIPSLTHYPIRNNFKLKISDCRLKHLVRTNLQSAIKNLKLCLRAWGEESHSIAATPFGRWSVPSAFPDRCWKNFQNLILPHHSNQWTTKSASSPTSTAPD